VVAWFYFLVTLEILVGLWLVFDGIRWTGYARRRVLSHPGFYAPRAAVICPCKGMEPGLDRNLLALCEFDYPDYEVFFVLASANDPAHNLLRQIAERTKKPKVHVVIAGSPQGCGEKVNNLRAAVEQLPPDFDVLVFADSDGRPARSWLQHLVAPLNDSRLGAATTMRWFFPSRGNLASALLAAWNASIVTLLGEHSRNFCWGGGTAIRLSAFEQAAVLDEWRGSVSDDLSMTRALARAGLPILFVPECLVLSYQQADFAALLEFTNRQIVITRVYSPKLWFRGAVAHILYSFTVLLGTFLLFDAWLTGSPALHLFVLTLAPMLLAAIRGGLRMAAVAEVSSWRQQVLDKAWIWTILAAFVPFLYALNFLASIFTRKIRWRGISYKLVSPAQTRILSW
jgi:cellulose synthase/poly-beta-1,6-N-acetylglucosamine synthase-like glycosyltransferase